MGRIYTDRRQGCADFQGRKLYGQHVFAETESGAALVLAGLSASGGDGRENPHFIERGYENLCQNLAALGGKELTGNKGLYG